MAGGGVRMTNDTTRLVHAADRCVNAFRPIVSNADGYDKSNFMHAIGQVKTLGGHFGAWTYEELSEVEREGRDAWKELQASLTESGTREEAVMRDEYDFTNANSQATMMRYIEYVQQMIGMRLIPLRIEKWKKQI